jgi:spermidine/putrescine-binding protein
MNRAAVTKKTFMKKITHKLIILCCYCFIGSFFLYLPLILDLFWQQNSLNVCVFSETFAPAAIELFQQETGIKVNLSYVEVDELLYAKFRMNGAAGYDVVNISDYLVHGLAGQGLLAPIDRERITNLNHVNQNLVGLVYDPANQFSVPHKWYVYGLVYDKDFFNVQSDAMSFKYVFEHPEALKAAGLVKDGYKICMLDDGRDALFLIMMYLFNRIDDVTADDISVAKKLLKKQKQWVEAYSLHSAEYFLLAGITPIALMSSNYIQKIYNLSNRFDFAIPAEGSMLVVENLAIPKTSKKVQKAQQFINFMLRDDIAKLNSSFYGFNSANKYATKGLSKTFKKNKHLYPDAEIFRRLHIPLLPSEQRKAVEDMWLEVNFS